MFSALTHFPTNYERRYHALLESLVDTMCDGANDIILNSKDILTASDIDIFLSRIEQNADRKIEAIIPLLSLLSHNLYKFALDDFSQAIKSMPLDIPTMRTYALGRYPTLDANEIRLGWLGDNELLVDNIKREFVLRVTTIVNNAYRNRLRVEDIAQDLVKYFNHSQLMAKKIARDQVANLNSSFLRKQCLDIGCEDYPWWTCLDEKVRHTHAVLHSKICSWLDPTIFKDNVYGNWRKRSEIGGVEKHVGTDWGCRCVAKLLVPTYLMYKNR